MNIMEALEQMTKSIKEWVDNNKVSKAVGKDLSTCDYTQEHRDKVNNMPNDLVIINGKLYLAQDGIPFIDSAVTLSDINGGNGQNGVVALTSKSPSSIAVTAGEDVFIEFDYNSNESVTGVAYVCAGGDYKHAEKIASGAHTVNVVDYVTTGTNYVQLICMDRNNNYGVLDYTVVVNQ